MLAVYWIRYILFIISIFRRKKRYFTICLTKTRLANLISGTKKDKFRHHIILLRGNRDRPLRFMSSRRLLWGRQRRCQDLLRGLSFRHHRCPDLRRGFRCQTRVFLQTWGGPFQRVTRLSGWQTANGKTDLFYFE